MMQMFIKQFSKFIGVSDPSVQCINYTVTWLLVTVIVDCQQSGSNHYTQSICSINYNTHAQRKEQKYRKHYLVQRNANQYILRETSNSESPHTHSFGSLPIKAAQKHGQSHRPYNKTCRAGNNHKSKSLNRAYILLPFKPASAQSSDLKSEFKSENLPPQRPT